MRSIIILCVVVLVATTTQGCALLLTGYLIGDNMQRNKNIENCRNNLKIQNDQRIKESKDPYPDMCGQ